MSINIFKTMTVYAAKWSIKDQRQFTEEEISSVDEAVVVSSTYGNSVCFFMKSGGQTYIPLDINSTVGVGEVVDLTKATIITLERPDENDIMKVLI